MLKQGIIRSPHCMNDENKNQLHDPSQDLTQSERASMRNHLMAFMAEHPALAPFWMRVADRLSGFFERAERHSFLSTRTVMPAFALVMVIGVGTSFAAEGALPGSPLYAIKVMFNEPLAGVFVQSDAAQAEWETKLVSRRLEEAEALVSKGMLTPIAQEELQASIAISAADFNTSVAKLAQSDDSAAVARVQSNFEASLAGHEEVLTKLSNSVAAKTQPIGPILASVSVHKQALAMGRANAEAKVAAKDGNTVRTIAATTRKSAKTAIRDVNAAMTQQGAPSASARISGALAENSASEGDSQFEQGNFGKAFMAFQAATREAGSAQVQIEAQVLLTTAATGTPTTTPTTAATSTDATSTAPTTSEQ